MKSFNVGFYNDVEREDETQFDAENEKEALELFEEFCKENGFSKDSVRYVEVDEVATKELGFVQLGFDEDAIECLMGRGDDEEWTVEEARKVVEKYGLETVEDALYDWNKKTIMNGYAVFNSDYIEGVEVIQRIDVLNAYLGDEDAAIFAEEDGVKFAWDLVTKMDRLGYNVEMYIDTKENRELIEGFIEKQEQYRNGEHDNHYSIFWLEDKYKVSHDTRRYDVDELFGLVKKLYRDEKLKYNDEEWVRAAEERESQFGIWHITKDVDELKKWMDYYGFVVHEEKASLKDQIHNAKDIAEEHTHKNHEINHNDKFYDNKYIKEK